MRVIGGFDRLRWSGLLALGALAVAACGADPPTQPGGAPAEPPPPTGNPGRPPTTPPPPGTVDPAPATPMGMAPGMVTPPTPGNPPVITPPAPPMGMPPAGGDAGAVDPTPVPPTPPPPSAAITFDPPGGNFLGNQAVKLVAGVPDTVIRFTTDGSLPSATSPVYSAPIMLAQTSIVRAVGESPTAGKGPVAAAIYVRAADDVATFESNLPIVMLHSHRSGTLSTSIGSTLVSGSVSVFEPAPGGKVKLVGPASFTKRAGVRIRGNSSRSFAQKSYGFELRQEGTDTDDDRAVLGLPSDSDWNLIAPSRPDRSLVRTAVAFTLSNEIGRYAPRVRLVEVFTVESGVTGVVNRAAYKGIYTLTEKIKVGKNRIRIASIDLGARNEPDVTGGYVFKIDHPFGTSHFRVNNVCHCVFDQANNMPFQFVDPDWDLLPGASRTAFSGYLRTYMQEFIDAVRAPDFKHPGNGKPYTDYIDVPAFIDHSLLNGVFKNVDSQRLSAYFYKERGGKVSAGPIWDVDLSSGTRYDDQFGAGQRPVNPREWKSGDGTDTVRYAFWGRLYADPVYQAAYKARFAELVTGPFSVAHIHELIDKFAAEVREAQARHFARWTEYPPNGGAHANEIRILKDWFAARIPWMTGELD